MNYTYDISMPKAYEKFFSRFNEIKTLPPKEWKSIHLVAYFAEKYFEYYKVKYQFKFDKPQPSKCFEVFTINRISMYVSKDPETIKHYIDWVFENIVPNCKKRLTSISFLIKESITVDYNKQHQFVQKEEKIDRTTPLPQKFLVYVAMHKLSIKTYGELSFVYQGMAYYENYKNLINDLVKIGLDTKLLENVT